MNFKKGDKVKFLHQNDYGTITQVMGNGIVMVLNSDDFEIPVAVSELILDYSSNVGSSEVPVRDETQAKIFVKVDAKKEQRQQPQHQQQQDVRDCNEVMFLAGFVPADGKDYDKCDLDFYFVNDSDYRICYNFIRPIEGSTLMQSVSGILEPDTKEFVATIKRGDIDNLSLMKFQLLFSKDKMEATKKPEECELKLRTPKFYQSSYYKENAYFDEKAVVLTIYQSGVINEALKQVEENFMQEKEALENISKPKKKPKRNEKEVVDLHLVEIIEDDSGMSPKDKLDYQLKYFREKLEEYIRDPHTKKVVFIHGKGNGKLRMEIRKCLDHNYKRYQYQDASFEEYGGGATLVYVK